MQTVKHKLAEAKKTENKKTQQIEQKGKNPQKLQQNRKIQSPL